MPQNKAFLPEEDNIIKFLYEEQKIKNWGIVAKTMAEQYSFPRNAKQCRDRYRQFLDPLMQSEWTEEEQKELYSLHSKVGNKWALIATSFHGKYKEFKNRTDNCVKNHFYSKLRKSLRLLNKVIKKHFKKEFRELKIGALYKIIQGFEEQFKEKPVVGQGVSNYCAVLKDALLAYSHEGEENQDEENVGNEMREKERCLIEQIIDFNKNYKKKTKKEKRQALQGVQLFKPVRKYEEVISHEEESDYEEVVENLSSESEEHDMKSEKEDGDIRRSPVIIIVEGDENLTKSNQSKQSKVSINSDLLLSEEIIPKYPDFLHNSGSDRANFPFGFLRGQSSFRSYNSRSINSSISKMDMFGDNLRLSEHLKQVVGGEMDEMDEQRDENLFRSQKEPVFKNRFLDS